MDACFGTSHFDLIFHGVNADFVREHHADFAAAAISPRADEACLLGAKGLAMTAVDVLRDPAFQDEIRLSHKKQVPECYRELMLHV